MSMTITLEDFQKLEIKIGTIISAEKVPDTDKLVKLEIDLGSEKRQIVAGIGLAYKTEEIAGKQIPILANLEPKRLRDVESQGMILAADDEGKPVLLHPGKEVPNGSIVK